MKFPTQTKRYCPYCRLQTVQKISVAKQKSRNATHPMSRGSQMRTKARGERSGLGNKGRYSKRPPKQQKRKSKSTKRMTILYTCTVCKKSKGIKKAIRSGRIEIGDKVAK
jgi:large subunit ribosomal protein L44e